jgi:general secretion pathway protein C
MASIAPLPTVPKRLIDALTFALLVLLGWQLASWTWHFLAPSAVPAAAPAAIAASPEAARRLFGEAPPAATSAAASNAGIRLKGVYAIDGRTLSAAVVNTGGKRDATIRVGEEILPGTRLAGVHPDHIIIARAGLSERIDLERRTATMPSKPGGVDPQGFRLNVAAKGGNAFSLSRTELNTVLQDPRQMNYLGRIGMHPDGGVRLEQAPAGSLPSKLGLKEGDVIKNVNGQPVNSPGDLARLYQQFATLSQIRAEVVRGGAPMLLTYQIQQ